MICGNDYILIPTRLNVFFLFFFLVFFKKQHSGILYKSLIMHNQETDYFSKPRHEINVIHLKFHAFCSWHQRPTFDAKKYLKFLKKINQEPWHYYIL